MLVLAHCFGFLALFYFQIKSFILIYTNRKRESTSIVFRYVVKLNPISTGLFLHPICTEGGKFDPLSKNRLVSDRSKKFLLLKLFFVKFLEINILRLLRHENDDDLIKTL